jgi:hypothetical protein
MYAVHNIYILHVIANIGRLHLSACVYRSFRELGSAGLFIFGEGEGGGEYEGLHGGEHDIAIIVNID